MLLAEWMDETKTTVEALAAQVGSHWTTVYRWRSRRSMPRAGQIKAIVEITGGRVTVADLLPQTPGQEAA
jgi:DNA-binding transcriptional regulator YdaS (Cro superfamily)